MPEQNQPQMPRRRVSLGFILIMVLVLGLIILLAVRIFGNRDTSYPIGMESR